MTSDDDHDRTEASTNTKVGRLIEEYDLAESYGDRLERLWTADDDRRESLRDLADRFNRRLLRAAVDGANVTTVDGEVDNLYRLLTDDDVSSGNRTEARGRLVESGLDVEQLERDFVTYQAIRSYLRDVRGAEYNHETTDSVSRTNEVVARLQSRTQSVAAQNLDRLVDADEVRVGKFDLLVNVDVFCEECNTKYDFTELLETGSCRCQE